MIRRQTYLFIVIISCFVCLFGISTSVYATEVLPPGVIIGDDSGLQVGEDGKYFIEHTDIKPGLVFEKNIAISNYAQKEGTFTLRLDMKADDVRGELNLLEVITVKLELEGKKIYEGDLAGVSDTLKNSLAIELGDYPTGTTRNLKATFMVSNDYPEEHWKKSNDANFFWVFYATNETEPTADSNILKPNPKPRLPKPDFLPQTGEEWRWAFIGVMIGLIVTMISLIIAKKRQKM